MSLFAAPIQGTGGGAANITGFPNPSYFLGIFSGSDPPSSNGQWWYRIDLGRIRQNVNGSVIDVTSENVTVIAGSETIGGANVTVTNDVVVLPSSTLVVYGGITFLGHVTVLGTLVSSNPNASSTAPASNTYTFYNNVLYLSGTYYISEYNNDVIQTSTNAPLSLTNVYASATGVITGAGSLSALSTLALLSNYIVSGVTVTGSISLATGLMLYAQNATLSAASVVGSGTLGIPSGYSVTAENTVLGIYVAGSGTLYVPSGYSVTAENATLSVSYFNISGTLYVPSGYSVTIANNFILGSSTVNGIYALAGPGTLYIPSGYSATIGANIVLSTNIAGSGTLYVPSGYSVTVEDTTLASNFVVSGTLYIPSGYSLTIPNNITLGSSSATTNAFTTSALAGSGTLYVPSSYTVTVPSSLTLMTNIVGGATIIGSNTLYIASGYNVTLGVSGSLGGLVINGVLNSAGLVSITTGYFGGSGTIGSGTIIVYGTSVGCSVTQNTLTVSSNTLTVNGVLVTFGVFNNPSSTADAWSTPPFPLSGTGIAIIGSAADTYGGAPNAVSGTFTMGPGANGSPTTTGVGALCGLAVIPSAIAGTKAGWYYLEEHNTVGYYYLNAYVYIGTASVTYSVPSVTLGIGNCCSTSSNYYVYLRNGTASSGTLTVVGTYYGG
jgi:hypothetical protein